MLTTGVPALDDLVDGVREGDNLVILAGPGVPSDLIATGFVTEAVASGPLVVVATEARAVQASPEGAVLLDRRTTDADGASLADELVALEASVGPGASYLVDSLSTVQQRWGDQAAIELFLATCPRLYRQGSVAMWLLDADRHERPFLERIREITQVVIEIRHTDDGLRAEVLDAAGRPATTVGRQVGLEARAGRLEATGAMSSGRARLGGVVRSLRTTRGLSQAELARRIGVSPSAVSQVERGVRGLSAETLIRIWEVLGVPFGPEDTRQRGYRIARRSAHRASALAAGVWGHPVLDDPAVGRCWRLTVDPGAAGTQPLFPGKATEVVLVLSGVLDVRVGGHAETLQEGDSLVASDALVEAWRNPSGAPAVVLWTTLR